MIVYNVTLKINESIHTDWLQWMKEKHIPEVMSKNCFTEYRIVRLLDIDDSEGPTYAVQYSANTKEDYDRYIEVYSPALRKNLIDKWGNNFIAFRSLMEVVN
ncbi:MAG: hypothetical protein JWQ30_569 [Sediminibacterium sp.]|nr:hypothetical protein [Sediminibacterium sp.]